MRSLTELIQKVADGDLAARDELFAAAYPELRKLARSRLRDGGRNTLLETTALVHETYLRFLNPASCAWTTAAPSSPTRPRSCAR